MTLILCWPRALEHLQEHHTGFLPPTPCASVLQSRHLGLGDTCILLPNIIFLEPSRRRKKKKKKLQLGEKFVYLLLSLNVSVKIERARCVFRKRTTAHIVPGLTPIPLPPKKKLWSPLQSLHLTLTTQRRSLMAQRVAQIGSELRYYQDNTPLSRFLKHRSGGPFSGPLGACGLSTNQSCRLQRPPVVSKENIFKVSLLVCNNGG